MERLTNINEPLINETQIDINNENNNQPQNVGATTRFFANAKAWFNRLFTIGQNLEIQRLRAEIELNNAETEKIRAETEKIRVEAETEINKAESERIKAEAERIKIENEKLRTSIEINNENQETDNRIMLWKNNHDDGKPLEQMRKERLQMEMRTREEKRKFEKENLQMLGNAIKEVLTQVLEVQIRLFDVQDKCFDRLEQITKRVCTENVLLKNAIYQMYMENAQNNFHMNTNQYQLNMNQPPQLDFLNTKRFNQLTITYEPKPEMEQKEIHLSEEI